MKGLLTKELASIGYYKRTLLIFILMIAAFAFFFKDSFSMIPAMMMMYLFMITQSIFQFDETAGWNKYAVSLPLSRRTIVGARYLFILLMILAAAVFSFGVGAVLALIRGFPQGWLAETAAVVLVIGLICLLVNSVTAPLAYKFGPEKGRIFLMLVFLVPYVGMVLLLPYFLPFFEALSPLALGLLAGGGVLLILVAYVLSWAISTRIYSKKEF